MLRVILVDDEPLARLGMRQLLADHPAITIVGEAGNAGQAAALITTERPDAVFLDIEMPRQNGFDLLAGLQHPPRVIFVTAHSHHAVQAFDFEAIDYLLKPVHPERLAMALRRLEAACAATPPPEESEIPHRRDDRLCLRIPGRTVLAPPESVIALKADGDFSRVFVAGEAPLLICQKLGHYERTLPTPPFARLDRSLIVNCERIVKTEVQSRDEARVWLRDLPEPLSLGRAAHSRLREKLAQTSPSPLR